MLCKQDSFMDQAIKFDILPLERKCSSITNMYLLKVDSGQNLFFEGGMSDFFDPRLDADQIHSS